MEDDERERAHDTHERGEALQAAAMMCSHGTLTEKRRGLLPRASITVSGLKKSRGVVLHTRPARGRDTLVVLVCRGT